MPRRDAFDDLPRAKTVRTKVAGHFDQSEPNATYRDAEGCFTHDVHLKSHSAFRLEPTMIESGRYTGLQAIVLTPTTTFPFEKLPPELRQMVYERVFCRSCTMDSTAHTSGMENAKWKHSSKIHCQQPTKRQGVALDSTRPELRCMSLLLTNRLIYTEARPFLYNGHDFVFHSMKQFNSFVPQLGTSARFLKSALIIKGGVTLSKRCYTLLNGLERLQKVTVTLPAVPTDHISVHVEKQWEHIKLFVYGEGVDEEESKRRVGLISFRVGPMQGNVLGSDRNVIREIRAGMNEACRRRLRRRVNSHFQTETETILL
ncbi:hypothetical protein D0869_05812 [Hortaea werneckii]|uniref:DUF7730 domain-containing protein n=1 Tax=Hortaea werneckii TaxID=91943 RepID=A0A3M6WVY4_HORWE|nr:hypothetical protein D0869_05812 [Hortaea werneckii]RMY00615.1 hypothetical protein D0867_11682 [Hortaea werneckii]RMY12917.1 hypothetical protein D0868_02311 [Hortaea werneckii]RMY21501.1 hypothetical protein D0866_12239 [Hortaea werneckii]